MDLDRVDIPLDHVHRPVDAKLREEERNLPSLGGEDLFLRGQIPELALERTESLLPGRVDELLLGLAFLALVGGVAEAPLLDGSVELGRERRMLEERVLEARRQVNLGGLDGREMVEEIIGQSRRAVLDGAGEPVLSGDLPEAPKDLEVELDLRHARRLAMARHHATFRSGR